MGLYKYMDYVRTAWLGLYKYMDEVRGLYKYVYGVACGCVRAMRRIESSRRNASASEVRSGGCGAAWGVWECWCCGLVVGVVVHVVGEWGGLVVGVNVFHGFAMGVAISSITVI